MDLIYTDASGVEQGVITKYSLDLEESTDKDDCTLEVQMAISDAVLELGSYVYAEGTEIGGRIDALKVDTSSNIVYASGRTWRGMLGSKIIEPPTGSAYYTASGDIEDVLTDLVDALSLGDMFEVSCDASYTVSYQFDRYTDLYTGLIKMMSKYNYKLSLIFDVESRKVAISSVPIADYTNESELTSDLFEFKLEKGVPAVNHMIGLGSGELTERLICHRYLQADGTVGTTQYYTGADEITGTYDYSNCESEDELIKGTEEQLLSNCVADKMEITAYDLAADIGDKFKASDITTGISMTQYVVDKIVTINNDIAKYQYEVGDKI